MICTSGLLFQLLINLRFLRSVYLRAADEHKKKASSGKDPEEACTCFLIFPPIHPGQDVAPFSLRRGCQGFTGPDPSTFLDKSMYDLFYMISFIFLSIRITVAQNLQCPLHIVKSVMQNIV